MGSRRIFRPDVGGANPFNPLVSAILFVQIASIVGVIIGGTQADRWMKKTNRGRIFTSAIGMVLFLPALFSVGNASTLPIAIVGLIIFGLEWGFSNATTCPSFVRSRGPNGGRRVTAS